MRCFVKGAPDVLIARGSSYWLPGGEVAAGHRREPRSWRSRRTSAWPQAGERVMVVARRDFDPATFDPEGEAASTW